MPSETQKVKKKKVPGLICCHRLAAIYWCIYHTRMHQHKTEKKKKQQQKEIHCSSVGRLFGKKPQRPQPMFSQQTAPHSCSPSLSIHPPQHPTWQREREAQTNSERKSLLAANPSLAGFSRTAVSNKESCLRKKREGKKKKRRVLHDNSAKRERLRRTRGMNDGEILLKSSNDRGQFLLTRRKRYNEPTDWWILRFKSRLIGSKRILRRLLRSVARPQVLSSVGKCRILELKPKEQASCVPGISRRHSTWSQTFDAHGEAFGGLD